MVLPRYSYFILPGQGGRPPHANTCFPIWMTIVTFRPVDDVYLGLFSKSRFNLDSPAVEGPFSIAANSSLRLRFNVTQSAAENSSLMILVNGTVNGSQVTRGAILNFNFTGAEPGAERATFSDVPWLQGPGVTEPG
ncbi:MAG: hypothetical protein ACYDCK_09500 [Thermoplasmatota archaeon]